MGLPEVGPSASAAMSSIEGQRQEWIERAERRTQTIRGVLLPALAIAEGMRSYRPRPINVKLIVGHIIGASPNEVSVVEGMLMARGEIDLADGKCAFSDSQDVQDAINAESYRVGGNLMLRDELTQTLDIASRYQEQMAEMRVRYSLPDGI